MRKALALVAFLICVAPTYGAAHLVSRAVKVASQPLRHPAKDAKALGHAGKALVKFVF